MDYGVKQKSTRPDANFSCFQGPRKRVIAGCASIQIARVLPPDLHGFPLDPVATF
jgi:hypothetical protein